MDNVTTADEHVPHAEHGHDGHHELSFLQSYVFSLDHKVIGIQYAITAMLAKKADQLAAVFGDWNSELRIAQVLQANRAAERSC